MGKGLATLTDLLGRVFAEVFEVHVAQGARDREPPVHPVVGDEAAGLQRWQVSDCVVLFLRHLVASAWSSSSRVDLHELLQRRCGGWDGMRAGPNAETVSDCRRPRRMTQPRFLQRYARLHGACEAVASTLCCCCADSWFGQPAKHHGCSPWALHAHLDDPLRLRVQRRRVVPRQRLRLAALAQHRPRVARVGQRDVGPVAQRHHGGAARLRNTSRQGLSKS